MKARSTKNQKSCYKCKKYHPLDDFHKSHLMKDGYLNKCRECRKKDKLSLGNRPHGNTGRARPDLSYRNSQNAIHGMSGTRIYHKWTGMKSRCLDSKDKDYRNYGARGIKIIQRWRKFKNFYADMGDPPLGFTLDRINVNGNYCKSNCRWASIATQINNCRRNRFIEFEGTRLTLAQWAKLCKTSRQTLRYRLGSGWLLRNILCAPLNHGNGWKNPKKYLVKSNLKNGKSNCK